MTDKAFPGRFLRTNFGQRDCIRHQTLAHMWGPERRSLFRRLFNPVANASMFPFAALFPGDFRGFQDAYVDSDLCL